MTTMLESGRSVGDNFNQRILINGCVRLCRPAVLATPSAVLELASYLLELFSDVLKHAAAW